MDNIINMNNLLFYVHFSRENQLNPHIIYQLEKLKTVFSEVFFISNSPLTSDDKRLLEDKKLFTYFLQRDHVDNDFSAWADGMREIGFENLKKYDSVTLMNDSSFGPIFNFHSLFKEMNSKEGDFWGLTNMRAQELELSENQEKVLLPDYIQTHFISFKKKLILSTAFEKFWSNVQPLTEPKEVLMNYEARLTTYFKELGFKASLVFDTRKESLKEMTAEDFSRFNLSANLEHGVPFLKVEAFAIGALNSTLPTTIEYIKQVTSYPTHLIVDYMTWFDYPDRPYMLNDKMIQVGGVKKYENDVKIGIHLHVFYKDLLKHFVNLFDQYVGSYDLYITTDTDESKSIIENALIGKVNVKSVLVVGKVGRDVLPWMKIHKQLSKYDIAGHFHTKKSQENLWIVGESWRTDIEKQLIEPAKQIFEEFQTNPQVGLVIPDVPAYYQSNFGPLLTDEEKLWNHMADLWTSTDFVSDKGLRKQDSYVMSFGTMVWYRPDALDNLLSLEIGEKIPQEPLPNNSILHAFERLLVYVAWGNNYDFRIAHSVSYNGFWGNSSPSLALRQLLRDGEDLTNLIVKDETLKVNLWKALRLRDIIALFLAKMKYIIQTKRHKD